MKEIKYPNGDKYYGNCEMNKAQGIGAMTYKINGLTFEGLFSKGDAVPVTVIN